MLQEPLYKAREHYNEILLSKAAYAYFNGDGQKSVDLLIEAITTNYTKSVDSLEVGSHLVCDMNIRKNYPLSFDSIFNIPSNASAGVTTIHLQKL